MRSSNLRFVILILPALCAGPIVRASAADGVTITGNSTEHRGRAVAAALVRVSAGSGATRPAAIGGEVLDPQDHPLAARDKASSPQLSGTVVDTSGAAIAGATVQVRSANGAVQKTAHSDTNGSFMISGLPAGDYRLVVSSPDFESKEVSVTIGTTGAPAPLRISLAVRAVSTTVNVQGRADDLIGIATSAGQITVGAEELKNRPLLRSGEILETLPGLIITQHAGGGKANQYFMRGFNLDHGTDFAIFIDGMPLNLPSHAHGEGYSDMNTVIPEFVERVDAEKGPYYAEVGDYGSAGNAHVVIYKTLPQNFVQADGGMYQFARFVFGISRKLGAGNLALRRRSVSRWRPMGASGQLLQIQRPADLQPGRRRQGFQRHGPRLCRNQMELERPAPLYGDTRSSVSSEH